MQYKLKDIVEVTMGQSPKSEYYNSDGDGVPFLQGNRTFGFRYPTFDTYTTLTTKLAEAGDVIMSVRAPVGDLNITPVDMCLGRGVCSLRMKNGNQDFLYYMMKYYMPQLLNKESGTVFGSVNRNDINGLEVDIPEDSEKQKRIARYLAMLDEKIELNMAINKNLLQQAGAVFDRFYVESSDQQLFTSLINVLGGGTPKTGNPEFWDGHIPFFTPKDVGTPYTFQTEKYITESGLAHCNSRLYPENTTFVTARGTVGKVSLAGMPMAMNQSCYALASETADPLLVYFYVLKAVASLKHKASGAVFDAIVTRDFDTETINVLSDDDAKSVLAIIKPMMEAIHNNSEENMRLAALRDSLLPRLMSGELDVSELDL